MGQTIKPGVMIYFELAEPIEFLDLCQRGQLLTAILEYGQNGTDPDFGDDKLLMMAWSLIQRAIDRDDESYKQTIQRRKYASYCKWEKEAGRVPVSFEEWLAADGHPEKKEEQKTEQHKSAKQKKQVHTSAKQKKPTTTTTTTTTTTPTPTTTPTKDISRDDNNISISSDQKAGPAPDIPTLEEVRSYVEINGLYVDPDIFFSYFEKKGWKGVVNWKAELRYWHARNRSNPGAGPGSGGVAVEQRQRNGVYFVQSPGYMSFEDYERSGQLAD